MEIHRNSVLQKTAHKIATLKIMPTNWSEKMLITLYDTHNKKERILIRYNPLSESIYIGLYYESYKYNKGEQPKPTEEEKSHKQKLWRERNPNYNYIWTKQHPENMQRKWRKNGNKRKRELGSIELSKNIVDGEVEWHHIDNSYVVAIPKDLHKLYYGMKRKDHRFMCNQIVAQLYSDKYSFTPHKPTKSDKTANV